MGSKIRGLPEAAPLKAGGQAPKGSRKAKSSAHGDESFSVGRYLAQQRSLRNISIQELEGLTKIPRRSLERLEAGAFDHDPDGFARGFVRTVAGALGLDPDEAVMRLLREPLDDDPELRRRPGLRAFSAAALALLGLGVIGAALWGSTAGLRSNPTDGKRSPEIVFRRDVVRELAKEQARLPAKLSPLAAPVQVDPAAGAKRRR